MGSTEKIFELIAAEHLRRSRTVQLIASENISSDLVRTATGSILSWKTGEGRPGNRFHSGCEFVDEIEEIAMAGANQVFESRRSWVQPLSCSIANLQVFLALKNRRKKQGSLRVLALGLAQGGHLSHGSPFHLSRELFSDIEEIVLDPETLTIDLESLRQQSSKLKPDLIISGASAYPREFPFESIGQIAQDIGAYHLADISHISGLVAAGVHPSPVPHSHLVTFSTYKAGGPRGGVIVAGGLADDDLVSQVERAIFPGVQGTPDFGTIAAKAILFEEMRSDSYRMTQRKIVANAKHLANSLSNSGFTVVTGGTDTHMVLVDTQESFGLTGKAVEESMSKVGIFANRNLLPFDSLPPTVTSGIRLGTNTVTRQGMGDQEMGVLAGLILDATLRESPLDVRNRVKNLASQFNLHPLEQKDVD